VEPVSPTPAAGPAAPGSAPVAADAGASALTATALRPTARGRLEVVDWLRGFAVVLMIQTHLYDAWVHPDVKTAGWGSFAGLGHALQSFLGFAGITVRGWYDITRFLGGIPSRLFLLLVGVSIALRFEAQLAKGVTDRRAMVRPVQRRGLEILVLAYAFRVQEYLLGNLTQSLANLPGHWRGLVMVDILNCIGVSMLIAPVIAAPWRGRRAWLPVAGAALAFIALGPVIGPARFPDYLPTWITSYLGGQKPMAYFPLFPWLAWPLLGVLVGHWWHHAARDRRNEMLAFVACGVGGVLIIAVIQTIRVLNPQIIRYPSYEVQQMGPGSLLYRLGMIGIIALIGWAVVRLGGDRFSVMRQFGRTSLLVYWVHVELCYGLLAPTLGIAKRLTMPQATLGLLVMIVLMLALSVAKTRYWEPWRRQVAARRKHQIKLAASSGGR
jgi:uncharacterized membrane protein